MTFTVAKKVKEKVGDDRINNVDKTVGKSLVKVNGPLNNQFMFSSRKGKA